MNQSEERRIINCIKHGVKYGYCEECVFDKRPDTLLAAPAPIPEERAGREATGAQGFISDLLAWTKRAKLPEKNRANEAYNRALSVVEMHIEESLKAQLAAQPSVQRNSNGWIEIKEGCEVPERGDTVTLLCEPRLGRDHAYQEINETCFTMGWEEMRACGVTHWKKLDWPSITAERGSKCLHAKTTKIGIASDAMYHCHPVMKCDACGEEIIQNKFERGNGER